MEWKPIETSPTDGTPVLVVCMKAHKSCKRMEGKVAAEGWSSRYKGFGSFNPDYYPATHWMPIPPLPPKGE